jgi:hypothetical protein
MPRQGMDHLLKQDRRENKKERGAGGSTLFGISGSTRATLEQTSLTRSNGLMLWHRHNKSSQSSLRAGQGAGG